MIWSNRNKPVDPALVFDLGSSGGADIARDKDVLIGEAVAAESHRRGSRRPE